jgi:hypothetical protein
MMTMVQHACIVDFCIKSAKEITPLTLNRTKLV